MWENAICGGLPTREGGKIGLGTLCGQAGVCVLVCCPEGSGGASILPREVSLICFCFQFWFVVVFLGSLARHPGFASWKLWHSSWCRPLYVVARLLCFVKLFGLCGYWLTGISAIIQCVVDDPIKCLAF